MLGVKAEKVEARPASGVEGGCTVEISTVELTEVIGTITEAGSRVGKLWIGVR